MKLFSGTASVALGKKIAQEMGISISPVDEHVFPDGERRIRIDSTVVEQSVVVIQSAYPPVDTNYMELFFLLDAVKRSGAEFVTAVVPYFGYQRQDHIFRDGEAVSLEVVIRILENLGIDKLVSIDMHSNRIPSLFHIPVRHVTALPLFANKIKEFSKSDIDATVLVSPDTGGVARIKKLSEMLDNMPYVVLEKDRDLETGAVTIGAMEDGSLQGKKRARLAGALAKRAIIADDMISSGTTIAQACTFLKKQGIEEVLVFATHPIFSEDAAQILQESGVEKVFVTDTVPVPKEKQFKKLEILSVAPLLAEALKP